MIKFTFVVLTLFTIGAQCRDYYYNKPLEPFKGEEQYLTTSKRMIIPGTYGRNYEVSMSPARNLFEMHLGHHQYYQPENPGYYPQQNFYAAEASSQNAGAYSQYQLEQSAGYQGNGYAQSQRQQNSGRSLGSHSQVDAQQSSVNAAASSQQYYQQQDPSSLGANAAASSQQYYQQQDPSSLGANAAASSQSYYQQQDPSSLGANAAASSQQYYQQQNANSGSLYYQQNPNSIGASSQTLYQQDPAPLSRPYYQQFHKSKFNKPASRIIRKCYPNGRCEYVAEARQQPQQQSQAFIIPSTGNCNKLPPSPAATQNAASQNAKPGMRDRRLFPYSEVPIAQYPYKK